MIINVGDLLTVLRFKDEATPLANAAFANMAQLANQAGAAVARTLTPAVQGSSQAITHLTTQANAATAAIGGGGGGATGGGGGGGGAGGGGLSGASHSAAYSFTLLGRGARELGMALTVGVTTPLVAAATAAFKIGKDFEITTAKFVTLAGVSKSELPEVKKQLLELASLTGKGPNELADAMYAASSTMKNTAVAMDIVTASSKLSAAGMGETNVIARSLTTVINSYGEENMSAARAANVLTRAVRDGGAEAKDLAPVLANAVPFAAKLGVSFEQLAANIATITKVGVPASEAVTQITSVFAMMVRETKRGTEALQTINMTYADLRAMVAGPEGLQGMIQMLADKFGLQDGRLFDVVGRLEALKNILGTTGAMAATYAYEVDRMNDVIGEADQAFEGLADTVDHRWNQALAEMQVLAIELFDELKPVFIEFFDFVRDTAVPAIRNLIETYRGMSSEGKMLTLTFLGIAAVAGPVLNTVGLISMGVGNLWRGVAYLGTTWGITWIGIGSSIAAVLPPLAILTAALIALYTAWDQFGTGSKGENFVATTLLSAEWWEMPIAPIYRLITGLDKLSEAQARVAVSASQMAEKQLKWRSEAELTFQIRNGTDKQHPRGFMPEPFSVDSEGPQYPSTGGMMSGSGIAGASGAGTGLGNWATELARVKKEYDNLSESQKKNIELGGQLGKSMKEIAEKTGVSEEAIKLYQTTTKNALKTLEDAYKDFEKVQDKTQFEFFTVKESEDIATQLDKLKDDLKKSGVFITTTQQEMAEEGERAAKRLEKAWKTTGLVLVPFKQAIEDTKTAQTLATEKAAKHAAAVKATKDALEDLVGALRKLGQVSGESFAEFTEGVAKALATWNVLIKATDTMKSGFSQLKGENKNIAQGLLNIAAGAAAAAAGFIQATGEGTRFQRTMSGAAAGAQMGSSGGAWGTAVGLVFGGIIGYFRGMSDEATAASRAAQAAMVALEKELARVKKAAFEAFQAFEKRYPNVFSGGNIPKELDKIGSALENAAVVAKAFGIAINFDVKTDEELKELERALGELGEKIDEFREGMDDLLVSAEELGIGLPDHIRTAIENMAALGVITQDMADRLLALGKTGEVSWKKMKEAADRYGISEHSLGAGFKQAKITAQASQIINDYDLLTRGGADAKAVIEGMKEEISKLVQDSIAFGTVIPENMRPWIQQLIDSKQLVDENGQLITDMGKIKFGAKLETEFEKLIKKLDEFISKLGSIPGLFGNIPTEIPFEVPPGGYQGAPRPTGPNTGSQGSGISGERTPLNTSLTVNVVMDRRIIADAVIDDLESRLALRGGR